MIGTAKSYTCYVTGTDKWNLVTARTYCPDDVVARVTVQLPCPEVWVMTLPLL